MLFLLAFKQFTIDVRVLIKKKKQWQNKLATTYFFISDKEDKAECASMNVFGSTKTAHCLSDVPRPYWIRWMASIVCCFPQVGNGLFGGENILYGRPHDERIISQDVYLAVTTSA